MIELENQSQRPGEFTAVDDLLEIVRALGA